MNERRVKYFDEHNELVLDALNRVHQLDHHKYHLLSKNNALHLFVQTLAEIQPLKSDYQRVE